MPGSTDLATTTPAKGRQDLGVAARHFGGAHFLIGLSEPGVELSAPARAPYRRPPARP